MIWGLIAARLGAETKKRLEPAMPPPVRREFAQAMLTDVINATLGAESLGGVSVLAGDEQAARLAASLGAATIPDPGQGLNPAVAAGMQFAAQQGASGVLVAMGDLPTLTAADINRVVAAVPERGAAAAASRDGTGTNLLALRPPGLIGTHFGRNSLALHQSAAREAGIDWQQVEPGGAALDVDTPEDLIELKRQLREHSTLAMTTRETLLTAGL